MKKYFVLLLLALGWSYMTFAVDKKEAFVEKAKSMAGHYKLVEGSNPKCSDGYLAFVGDKVEQGLHLGHDVFVGPFVDTKEQEKDYCQVAQKISFSPDSVTQVTEISRCPASSKSDESVATKHLSFKGNEVYFEIKESGFKCKYVKVAKGGSNE
tara:strand:- start:8015 stop:8476 length:462 start_codon:yes stop_codon:yes gene_type:complete